MENKIVLVSSFTGYEPSIRSILQNIETKRNTESISVITEYQSISELSAAIHNAWNANHIPIIQADIWKIKEISDELPDDNQMRIFIAPDGSNHFYRKLLEHSSLQDTDIDNILDITTQECEKIWLYDNVIVDKSERTSEAELIELTWNIKHIGDAFDLLEFQDEIADLLTKRASGLVDYET